MKTDLAKLSLSEISSSALRQLIWFFFSSGLGTFFPLNSVFSDLSFLSLSFSTVRGSLERLVCRYKARYVQHIIIPWLNNSFTLSPVPVNDLKLLERSAFSHFNLRISRLIEENASQLLLAQSLNLFFCKEKSMFKVVMNHVDHMTKFLLFATTRHIFT